MKTLKQIWADDDLFVACMLAGITGSGLIGIGFGLGMIF